MRSLWVAVNSAGLSKNLNTWRIDLSLIGIRRGKIGFPSNILDVCVLMQELEALINNQVYIGKTEGDDPNQEGIVLKCVLPN